MPKSIRVIQQEIRSFRQNFDWETNPDWEIELKEIHDAIEDYWVNTLKRKYNHA